MTAIYKNINDLVEQPSIGESDKIPVTGGSFVFFSTIKSWILSAVFTVLSGTHKYIPFDDVTSFGWKNAEGLVIAMYQRYGTNTFGQANSYNCVQLYQCNYNTPTIVDSDTGATYPNPTNPAKIAGQDIWTSSPLVTKYRHKLCEGIYGTINTSPSDGILTTPLTTVTNGIGGYVVKNNSTLLFGLSTAYNYTLNLTTLLSYLKLGMTYKMICKNVGTNMSKTLTITDTIGNRVNTITNGQWFFIEFIKVDASTVLCAVFDVR